MGDNDCCTNSNQRIQEACARVFAHIDQMASKAHAEIKAMAERDRRGFGQKVRWQLESLK